ncbi:MAG: SDR family oxidoreductase [Acidobacteria bacterium]|nr:SDR family oxidoreductase [Acidobacteriota bacterium]
MPTRFEMFDPDQFRGKVVMITGAGRGTGPGGIGYNAAMAFARSGARLAIVGRTGETLGATRSEIEALGGEVVTAVGDVSDPAVIGGLFDAVENRFGRLDILINNAGVSGEVRALVRIPSKSFRYATNVHLHTMATTRLAARLMRGRGIHGTILNVGTYFTSPHRQILRPYPFRTPYTGAQAWKLEHSRVSAWELADDGIRVIALNLGPVEGGRIDSIVYPLGALERGLWGRDVQGDDIRRKTEEMHPAKRFLTQEDAARSILALASRELRDSANGTVVELAGGVDYKVPPQVAPPLLGNRLPDLEGRQVVLVGRPSEEQAATLALAFAACGADVVLAAPAAGRILSNLAGGRAPDQYTDGQRTLLGRLQAIDLAPEDEGALAALFDRLTTSAAAPEGGAPPQGAAGATGAAASAAGGPDVVVALTGDVESPGTFSDMTPQDEEALKQRFAFEPAGILRGAQAAMLLQGMRRAAARRAEAPGGGPAADGRFQSFRSFLALLERPRGVASKAGIQRVKGGWTPEEEKTLQAGARQSRGSIILIGPQLCRETAEDAPVVGVARAGLQAVVTSTATEMASARCPIRVNAIFPGSDAGEVSASRTARTALHLSADSHAGIAGMIYCPDERNAGGSGEGALAGKTAVVTGGGRNLGQAIAMRLAREGSRVILAGRGRADLDLTARAIMALGGRAHAVAADIAFPGDRARIVEAARGAAGGGIDLWVNNAGIGGAFATLAEIELDGEARWHQTLGVNFAGAWLGMVRAILDMRRRGASGGVVNVSTFYADQPYVFRIPYTAPKLLLRRTAALLADALKPYGIFIADIEPSLIDGPRFQWVARSYAEHFRRHGAADPLADPAVKAWFERLIPERAPRAGDVAQAVLFAAQRGLTGTGQEIAVSTLPRSPRAAAARGRSPRQAGGTAVIVTTARDTPEIDRVGSIAAFCLESGSRRVIVAGDDGMMARLGRRLSRGASDSSWWNLPIAPEADGRLEIRGVDSLSAAALAEVFAGLDRVDSVFHVPADPGAGERFVLFPADPTLSGLGPEAVEARYRDHQRALSLFLERQVTGGLVVARQAARSLAPGGSFVVSRRRPRAPEAILATEAQRQIVRTAAEEFRLLGVGAHAAFTHAVPALGARLAALQAASA